MIRRIAFALWLSLSCAMAHAQWQLLPGLARDIGVSARGDAWAVGVTPAPGGYTIHHWNGRNWDLVPGGAMRIDVDPRGTPWVVNAAGQILRLERGGWQQLPGLARDIGIGANGAVWVIGVTPVAGGFTIHRWNGRDWDLVPGGAVRIDVDPRGNPWVVNDRGEVLRFDRVSWRVMGSRATAVAVATDGTAWLLTRDRVPGGFAVQRWVGNGWRRVSGGGVALGAGEVPWLVNSSGQIYVWGAR